MPAGAPVLQLLFLYFTEETVPEGRMKTSVLCPLVNIEYNSTTVLVPLSNLVPLLKLVLFLLRIAYSLKLPPPTNFYGTFYYQIDLVVIQMTSSLVNMEVNSKTGLVPLNNLIPVLKLIPFLLRIAQSLGLPPLPNLA